MEAVIDARQGRPPGKFDSELPAGAATSSHKRQNPLEVGASDIAREPCFDERKADESAGECLRHVAPSVDRESDAGWPNFDALLRRFADESLDPFEVPPLCFGQIGEVPEKVGIEGRR